MEFLDKIDTPFEFYLIFLLIFCIGGLIYCLITLYMIWKYKIGTAVGLVTYQDTISKGDIPEHD